MKLTTRIILLIAFTISLSNCDKENHIDPNPIKVSYLDYDEFVDQDILIYLPFDNNSVDYSSNNIYGNRHGLYYVFDRFNHQNGACYFDGSNSYISYHNDDLITDTSYTICFWYRPYFNDTLKHVIASNADSTGSGFTLSVYNSGDSLNFEFKLKNNVDRLESRNLIGSGFSKWIDGSKNNFHFAAIAFNKSEIFDYQTGNKITLDRDISFSNLRYDLSIGWSENHKVVMYNGALDDFLIYKRFLTTDEIETIYNLRKN